MCYYYDLLPNKAAKMWWKKNFLIALRKCNANISNAQDYVEMGGAALHSLRPALSFRCPMTTNKKLELLISEM